MFEIDYLRENSDKVTIKKGLVSLLTAFIFFSLFYLLTFWIKQNSSNRDDIKLTEVRKIHAEIGDYPNSSKTDKTETSRSSDACIHKYLVSKAELKDIEAYYEKELTANGWNRQNSESFKFSKQDFFFNIEQSYKSETNRNFAVSMCWKNNGRQE